MCDTECPRCHEDHGPLWIFRSNVDSFKACYHCIAHLELDARSAGLAAGVDYTVTPT